MTHSLSNNCKLINYQFQIEGMIVYLFFITALFLCHECISTGPFGDWGQINIVKLVEAKTRGNIHTSTNCMKVKTHFKSCFSRTRDGFLPLTPANHVSVSSGDEPGSGSLCEVFPQLTSCSPLEPEGPDGATCDLRRLRDRQGFQSVSGCLGNVARC